MKKLSLLTALLFATAITFARSSADTTLDKFLKLVAENKMEFTAPEGTEPVPVVVNRQVLYEYAVKFKDKPIEIRYSIFSLADQVAEYKKYLKEKPAGVVMANPNSSEGMAFAVALNVGGGSMDPNVRFNPFPPEHIKPEFGADKGGTWIVPIKNNSFGTEYKYCIMISLHRDDVADAFIMYLGNTPQDLFAMFKDNPGLGGLFYALKFKD